MPSMDELRRMEMKKAARESVMDRVDFLDGVAQKDPITYRHLNAWKLGYLSFEEVLMLSVANHVQHEEMLVHNAMQSTVETKVRLDTKNEIAAERQRLRQNLKKYLLDQEITVVKQEEMERAIFGD